MMLARFYNFQTFNSWFTSGGAGTMGCALPMAVGVKLARPDERVWAVSGDGGFQMNIQELGAVMEHGVDIKILLLNNGYLGMVRQWQTLFYDGRYAGTPMKNPDFGAIAGAYGIPHLQVTDPGDVEEALKTAMMSFGALENQLGVAECELELGRVKRDEGDLQAARERLEESARLFGELGAAQEAKRAAALLAETEA